MEVFKYNILGPDSTTINLQIKRNSTVDTYNIFYYHLKVAKSLFIVNI